MPRRVLLAEQNDTIRGVAETVLRQNSFDVISVNNQDKLFEILELSSPDIFIIDSTLCDQQNQTVFQKLRQDPKTSSIPLLLLADEYHESLGLPSSLVVLRPFNPANLLNQVNHVLSSQPEPNNQSSPFDDGNLDDDFLDSALGLDHLEVTDSEDMDKTNHRGIPIQKENTKMMGIGQFGKSTPEPDESSKIESLMITDDKSDINSNPDSSQGNSFNDTGLQLSDDQYGLTDPDSMLADNSDANHDYSWFVNSMQSEKDGSAGLGTPPAQNISNDNLEITDTSGIIDPVTPGPSHPAPQQSPPVQSVNQAEHESGGMDKFIDEFRQEAEKLGESGLESIVIPQETTNPAQLAPQTNSEESFSDSEVMLQSIPEEKRASWEDKIENITPDHLRIFSRELAGRLADKIAGLILARIDQDKLLRLIKDELVEEIRKKS